MFTPESPETGVSGTFGTNWMRSSVWDMLNFSFLQDILQDLLSSSVRKENRNLTLGREAWTLHSGTGVTSIAMTTVGMSRSGAVSLKGRDEGEKRAKDGFLGLAAFEEEE